MDWISVEDRLPEHNVDVLIFAEGKEDGFKGDTVQAISSIRNQKFFNDAPDCWLWVQPWQFFRQNYRITHWMPLPEPPKKKYEKYEWISTKDAFPSSETILCLVRFDGHSDSHRLDIAYYSDCADCWESISGEIYMFDTVTHWMPVPDYSEEAN